MYPCRPRLLNAGNRWWIVWVEHCQDLQQGHTLIFLPEYTYIFGIFLLFLFWAIGYLFVFIFILTLVTRRAIFSTVPPSKKFYVVQLGENDFYGAECTPQGDVCSGTVDGMVWTAFCNLHRHIGRQYKRGLHIVQDQERLERLHLERAAEDEGIVGLYWSIHGMGRTPTPIVTSFTAMTALLTAELLQGTLELRRIELRCFSVLPLASCHLWTRTDG